jgi:lysophospholipid acyltransferase (LPLAT)-like uncharacterized protein
MTEAAKCGAQPPEEQPVSIHYDTRPPQLPLWKCIQIPLVIGAAVALQHAISPTLRFDVVGRRHFEQVHAAGRRCIFTFWHRAIFLLTWWFRNRGIVALTSANFDGQLIAGLLKKMGYGTAQGSSTRGGLRGLVTLAQQAEEGRDTTFAIDGPRGPRYVAKPGPVLLARRTGCKIICVHACAERCHTFEKSWDQFQMPYPFSRAVLVIGPPTEVPRDANRETLKQKQAEMQAMLERVRNAAEGWFKLTAAERERERALWDE